jgi:hypothetical protein
VFYIYKGELILGVKDGKSKEFLKVNERFADAFNYYMYDGRQVIKPENLTERDTNELLTVYGFSPDGAISDKTIQKLRDILKNAVIMETHNCLFALLGVENHTDIHYAAVVKNMIYDAIDYGSQVISTSRRHRTSKDYNSGAEFLSGFTKEDKLIPIITLTIYWGADKWDAPRSLHEMFREEDREEFGRFVSDYKLNLIVPSEIEDFEKFSTELGGVLEVIKSSHNEDDMNKVIERNHKFEEVSNDVISILNTFTGLNLKVNMEGEKSNMCKAWEDHKRRGELELLTRQVLRKLQKNKSVEEIVAELEEDENMIKNIVKTAESFSPDYDIDKIVNVLLAS